MTERRSVEIRPAREPDAGGVRSVYAPFVTDSFISFDEDVPTRDEFVRRMTARPRLPWLVAEHDGVVVGFAYGSRHRERAAYRWSVDCSVYLTDAHQRRGIARSLYDRLIDELRGLGYVSAFAGITLPNAASVGLHEAVGFRPLGVYERVGFKLGGWRDVGWWSLQLVDPPPPTPAEPLEWRPGRAASRGEDAVGSRAKHRR